MGIQITSAYTGFSLVANSPQQRQTSARATATFTASAASLADKTTISQAARDVAVQENKNTFLYSAPHAADQRFPPASAPAGVSAAWSAATQGMSDLDRVSAEGAFMAEEISANLIYDSGGRAISIRQRGEPGYVDLWKQPGVSYPEQVDQMLKKLEQNHSAYTAKDYAFYHNVLAGFRAALSSYDAR